MLVKGYDLHCPNGTLINISIDYQWLSSKCNSYNIIGHTTTICPNNKVDKLSMVEETSKKNGVVRTISLDNKQNQFQWQKVVKTNNGSKNDENDQCCELCDHVVMQPIIKIDI
jgi:hypothetical protein